MMTMMSTRLHAVRTILKQHAHSLTPHGSDFIFTVYTEFDDRLRHDQLDTISWASDKQAAFDTCIDDMQEDFFDYEGEVEDELERTIAEHWDDTTSAPYDEDAVRDFLREYVHYEINADHYRQQSIQVNLLLDTGDSDYDFTLNNFASYNAQPNAPIHSASSILWLVKQQGYTRSQLEHTLRHPERSDDPFLQSVYEECSNVTSSMNALVFLVRMRLQTFIDWSMHPQDLTLARTTPCGLYDPWNGAGGGLDITLARDVVLPVQYVKPHIEGTLGCGAQDVYGIHSRVWADSIQNLDAHNAVS